MAGFCSLALTTLLILESAPLCAYERQTSGPQGKSVPLGFSSLDSNPERASDIMQGVFEKKQDFGQENENLRNKAVPVPKTGNPQDKMFLATSERERLRGGLRRRDLRHRNRLQSRGRPSSQCRGRGFFQQRIFPKSTRLFFGRIFFIRQFFLRRLRLPTPRLQ